MAARRKRSGARSSAQVAAQKKAAAASAAARRRTAGTKAKGAHTAEYLGYKGTGTTKVGAARAARKRFNSYTARAYGIKGGDAAYHSQVMREGRRIEQGKAKNAQGLSGPKALGSRRRSVQGIESTGTRMQRARAKRERVGAYDKAFAKSVDAKNARNRARQNANRAKHGVAPVGHTKGDLAGKKVKVKLTPSQRHGSGTGLTSAYRYTKTQLKKRGDH